MTMNGIDVSKYQGKIDWKKARSCGVEFAMIRAVSSNKNGLYVDPYFHSNVEGAKAVGIHVGAYIYTYATNIPDVQREMAFLIHELKKHEFDMPIAFDIEYEPKILALSKETKTTLVKTAMSLLEQAGYYAMIYASKNFYDQLLDNKQLQSYDVWIAQYSSKCTASVKPGIWQHTSKGKVYGINGNVDLDIAYKDYPSIISGMSGGYKPAVKTYTFETGPMTEGDLFRFKELANGLDIPFTVKEV